MLSKEVTITLPREQFNEICNLLQLIVVLDVKLYIQGHQPKKHLLKPAFDTFIEAGMPKVKVSIQNNEGIDNVISSTEG